MSVPVLYPIIMLLAVGAGAWILKATQRPLGLPTEQRVAIGLAAFCGAMLGAKAPFLLQDWDGLRSGAAWFSSGKTIMCGMVGAYFGVELAKWTLGIRTKTGDSFVIPAAVSIGIGRWACLVAGCCYGIPSQLPWALRCSANDELLRHPTQIYESVFHLSMAALLYVLKSRKIWPGQLAKFYIITYLCYRFLTEFLRPETRFVMELTAYQYFALALIPVFAFLWWRDQSALNATKRKAETKTPSQSSRLPESSSITQDVTDV